MSVKVRVTVTVVEKLPDESVVGIPSVSEAAVLPPETAVCSVRTIWALGLKPVPLTVTLDESGRLAPSFGLSSRPTVSWSAFWTSAKATPMKLTEKVTRRASATRWRRSNRFMPGFFR
jgi:hypothetical protein